MLKPRTYEEFEDQYGLSGSSREAYYAESAWNHALKEALDLVVVCSRTETSVGGLRAMLEDEIREINTGFYGAQDD